MKVFLSSTYEDLADYRRAVMDVLQECEILYKGMEFFGATEYSALNTCLENISDSDRVIVLMGSRYGSRPSDIEPSYTESEIREAIKLVKPIQAYFLDLDSTPVLVKHVDTGQNADDLKRLKKELATNFTIETFDSPADLGRVLARDLFREKNHSSSSQGSETKYRRFRETAYDSLAEWYDFWYQGHWDSDEPFHTIAAILRSYHESSRGNINGFKILDCACGTGNSFASFAKHGFEIYGTDGSHEMLQRAHKNCISSGISVDRLIVDPINWTDGNAYEELFGQEAFDVIINTANSFCHIPPVSGYMDVALKNFYNLLKPSGLLIIDTKKYIRSDPTDGTETYRELRYDANLQEWIVRSERFETCQVDGYGEVSFHTRLMYDNDPAFNNKHARRALIVLTIHGSSVTPRVLVIPYYPLSSTKLREKMRGVNLTTSIIPAMEGLAAKWKYDFVVGQKL